MGMEMVALGILNKIELSLCVKAHYCNPFHRSINSLIPNILRPIEVSAYT